MYNEDLSLKPNQTKSCIFSTYVFGGFDIK